VALSDALIHMDGWSRLGKPATATNLRSPHQIVDNFSGGFVLKTPMKTCISFSS
jgi:hypothetical protein